MIFLDIIKVGLSILIGLSIWGAVSVIVFIFVWFVADILIAFGLLSYASVDEGTLASLLFLTLLLTSPLFFKAYQRVKQSME